MSRFRIAALLALALFLGGCASLKPSNPRDPFETFNRPMLQLNDGLDALFLRPVATAYKQHVPPPVRTGVSNFFNNLSDGWSFVNSALQFRLYDATDNFARFMINTTWGIGGIFDIASEFNIDRHREDFGQTLGRWGLSAGPYLMLPFYGPSTLRDTLAMTVDRRAGLVDRIDDKTLRNSAYVLQAVDRRSNLLRVGQVLEEAALDRYTFIRDAHLQRRRAEVEERTVRDFTPPTDAPAASPAAPAASAPAEPASAPASAPVGQPQPAPAR